MNMNFYESRNNTNCLNGTFLTFNGNEFVLQNDMGNGRVETAYLPSGYVPVGIKEHGGIIYVASYNPLTNRSQIGSFPSPERNISSEELNTSNNSLKWEDFWSSASGDDILTSTVARIQISSNIVRSGDKFSIMFKSEQFNELSKWISNFNNVTSDGHIKYHHNKLLTIQIATEDSSGNLIDITEALKRTQTTEKESNVVIEFDPNTLPQIKFNSGYFIQEYTAGDSNDLTRFRQSKALNTYNNKISGNLYIVATLNTITYYNISLFGYKNTTGQRITVDLPDGKQVLIENGRSITCTEVEYQYNCPDGYGSDILNVTDFPSDYCPSNEFNPSKVLGGTLLDASFWNEDTQLSDKPINTWSLEFPISSYQNSGDYYHPSYDETTGLYTLKELLLGNVITGNEGLEAANGLGETGYLQYELTPYMTYGKLDGLSTTVGLNLSLLGSGETKLTTWKYYINQDNVDVTWGFSSYPLYKHDVKGILFEFKELSQQSNTQKNYALYISGRESYNGIFTNSVPLQTGNIYVVKITVFQGPIGTNMSINLEKGDLDSDIIVPEDTKFPDSITQTIFWRTLICDQSYNQYYSTTQDMTENIKGIDIKLIGNTSATYTRSNAYTQDEVNLQYTLPITEGDYEEKYIHNNVQLKLDYVDTYQPAGTLFTLDSNILLNHTITNGAVSINSDINIISENVTFSSDFNLKTQLSSKNVNEIIINSDKITILYDVPMQYNYTNYSKFVDYAYRPLKENSIPIIGSRLVKDELYYTLPWWKSGKNESDRAVDCYKMLATFIKQFFGTTGSTNDRASFKADGVDKFNWGYGSILGTSPALVFVSSNGDPRTNIRKNNGGRPYEHIQIYAKNTGGGYDLILFSRNKPIRQNELDRVYWKQTEKERLDTLSGDPLAIINEVFLQRIYTYQEYKKNVNYYSIYGYKYINDIKTTCQIQYMVSSTNYQVYYHGAPYTNFAINSWLDQFDKTLKNNFIASSLYPKFNQLKEYYTIQVPIVFNGSYILYNEFQYKQDTFSNSIVAIVDYHDRSFFLIEADNSPLIQNYWYYLYDINEFNYDNPQVYNNDSEIGLTKVPNWLQTYFQLTDGVPLIHPTSNTHGWHTLWMSNGPENSDHGWHLEDVLVNTSVFNDSSFTLDLDLAHELTWLTTDVEDNL